MADMTDMNAIVDAHFHVIAAPQQWPMRAERSYTPPPAPLSAWRETLAPQGVTHGVVVQPSVYGTDNRVLLAALAEGAGRLVGVAAVAADVSDAELDRLVAAGVRGVRMAHFTAGDPRALGGFVPWRDTFDALEPRLHARGLHLQLFTDARLLPALADRLAGARVPVVIDHMGRTPASLGTDHDGLRTLAALLRDAPVWVKLSGIANLSDDAPLHEDARRVHEVLVAAAPHRLVWGSDWPHTRPAGAAPCTRALLALARRWTPVEHQDAIFRGNAARLYGLGP